MASFTDELVQFNPYVSQIPESYHQVGLMKQARYEEGVQRVQGFIDSVAGLEVMKEGHRDYINHRVTDLTTNLNRLASNTDFSNQSFINQIGGYASKIASDPIVQNAVASTLKHKKNLQYIEDERKKGVYTTENEWDYNKQLSTWLSDGDLRSSFTGTYSNVVDVMGEFYKAFKEAHPSSNLTQDAFRVNDEGKIVVNEAMEELASEGISPQTVQSIANTVFNRPDVKNQLRISGQYAYRGYDQQSLAESVRDQYKSMIKQTNDQIEDLRLKMTVDKTIDGVAVTRQIDQLKQAGSRIVEDYKSYASLIATNPEAAKAALYQNNLASNLMKSFSWTKESSKVVDNPLYKAQLDMLKYNLDVANYNLDVVAEARMSRKDELDYDAKIKELQAKKLKGEGQGPGESNITYNPRNVEQEQGIANASTFMDNYEQTKQNYSEIASEGVNMIAGISGIVPPKIKNAQGMWIWNPAYKDTKLAEYKFKRIMEEAEKHYRAGKAGDATKTMFTKLDPLMRTLQNMDNVIKTADESLSRESRETIKKIGEKGLNPDLIDYWITENDKGPGAESAARKLEDKYGSNWKSKIKDLIYPRYTVTTMGSSFRPDVGTGVHYESYQKLSKALKENKNILPDISRREEIYRNAQVRFNPVQGDITAGKPESIREINQAYMSALGTLAQGNNSGAVNRLLEWTQDDKDEKITSNLYGGYFNRFSGKAYLTIRRGEEVREVEVPVETFTNLGFKTNDPFWDIHGDDLALSGNTKTDNRNLGGGDAYDIPMPQGSRYQVKYHLAGTGGGNYAMRVFVYDAQGNTLLDGASYSPSSLGRFMTGSEVMTARETLQNEAVIQGLINKSGKK